MGDSSRKKPERDVVSRREAFRRFVNRAKKADDDQLAAIRSVVSRKHPLDDQLRFAIAMSEMTQYRLSAATGIDSAVLSRFMGFERDIRLETAAKLAAALEVSLQPQI
jgi:DNA-binding Xre family transcriptional regulator